MDDAQTVPQHLHIVGVCGTAMAAIALLARDRGWRVTGSDAAVYPPMSEVLATAGIVVQPFAVANLEPAPDLCLVGNAISRGNVEIEAILQQGLPYSSGAAFVGDYILPQRHAVVVAATHGKTSTSSMLAHVLQQAGLEPGFMIGGVPEDFGSGARLGGKHAPFVLEGDEYDTALFDKRSKFLHYHARTLILNNLEYDHADIFPDLEAIKTQFSHLLRTVPSNGCIVLNADDEHLADVVQRGCWTPCVAYAERGSTHAARWQWRADCADGSAFTLWLDDAVACRIHWRMIGVHQVANACAVTAAAHSMGVAVDVIADALSSFSGVRRRMTLVKTVAGVRIFDDFAHHPTAIRGVVTAAKAAMTTGGRLWVVLEPRSNTMRSRIHQQRLVDCFDAADRVLCLAPAARGQTADQLLDTVQLCAAIGANKAQAVADHDALIAHMQGDIRSGDDILILSNGGVEALHQRLFTLLSM
jgi:UDP-N-acetylmuramate: L-alanyl-gamma-D-glutamyl-meso-diaminopimelate ligase